MRKKTIRLNRVIYAFGHEFNNARYTTNSYANKSAYIDAVYRANKKVIDNSDFAGTEAGAQASFKAKVKEYLEEGSNINEAIKKTFRSEIFITREERDEYFHEFGIRESLKDDINKDKLNLFKKELNLKRVQYKRFNYIKIDGEEYLQYNNTNYGFYLRPTDDSLHPYEFVFVDNLTAGI